MFLLKDEKNIWVKIILNKEIRQYGFEFSTAYVQFSLMYKWNLASTVWLTTFQKKELLSKS